MDLREKVAALQELNMKYVKGPFEVLEYEASQLNFSLNLGDAVQ